MFLFLIKSHTSKQQKINRDVKILLFIVFTSREKENPRFVSTYKDWRTVSSSIHNWTAELKRKTWLSPFSHDCPININFWKVSNWCIRFAFTDQAWCTLLSPCGPSPWLSLQTASGRGHGRRPAGSRWNCTISEWERDRLRCPGPWRKLCSAAPDPCLSHSLCPAPSGSWTASRKAAAPSPFPCCRHAGLSNSLPSCYWHSTEAFTTGLFHFLSALSPGCDSRPVTDFPLQIPPPHFWTPVGHFFSPSGGPPAAPGERKKKNERWGKVARRSDNTNPTASSSIAHIYLPLTAPPQRCLHTSETSPFWTHDFLSWTTSSFWCLFQSVRLSFSSRKLIYKAEFNIFKVKRCLFNSPLLENKKCN